VTSVSWFIITRTVRNKFVRRLRRLREPRYLIGALVGAGYLYVSVFARIAGSRSARRRRGTQQPSDEELVLPVLAAFGPSIGGLALLGVAALCWVLPVDASLLHFSEAEVQFLFPAPVSRRQLVVHRLLRSQLGLLVASVVPALLTPSSSVWMRLRTALGMWLLLVTGKVYFMGVTLARSHLRSSDAASRRAAWTPALLVLGATAIVAAAVGRAFWGWASGVDLDALSRLASVAASGAARFVLAPFVALARPLFSESPIGYAVALLPAALVLAVTVWWVIGSDETFQADVTEMAAQRSEARTAQASPIRARGRWALPLSGRTETLFFWKNGMHALRNTNSIALLRYVGPLVFLAVVVTSLRLSAVGAQGLAAAFGTFALFAAGFAALLGPQIVRTDLRMDLAHLELLKTWPVAPTAIVRGEMLWPGAAVTSVAWFSLACALAFSGAALPRWPLVWRLSSAAGAALFAPALVFAQLAVHAAAAVLFPAWVPLGDQRPRGLDAMGQRLILFGGVVLTLIVVVGPGAIAGAILWFLLYRTIGPVVLVLSAVVCVAIVAAELWAITGALGRLFEGVDLSGVERAE
jgi:hypothetical protein